MKQLNKVVIIGGSGMVGMKILEVMARHNHDTGEIIVIANRTVGEILKTPYGKLKIQPTTVEICQGADLVYLAAGAETSRKLAQPILKTESKVRVIDLSSEFRYERSVPLVICRLMEIQLKQPFNCHTQLHYFYCFDAIGAFA